MSQELEAAILDIYPTMDSVLPVVGKMADAAMLTQVLPRVNPTTTEAWKKLEAHALNYQDDLKTMFEKKANGDFGPLCFFQ